MKLITSLTLLFLPVFCPAQVKDSLHFYCADFPRRDTIIIDANNLTLSKRQINRTLFGGSMSYKRNRVNLIDLDFLNPPDTSYLVLKNYKNTISIEGWRYHKWFVGCVTLKNGQTLVEERYYDMTEIIDEEYNQSLYYPADWIYPCRTWYYYRRDGSLKKSMTYQTEFNETNILIYKVFKGYNARSEQKSERKKRIDKMERKPLTP